MEPRVQQNIEAWSGLFIDRSPAGVPVKKPLCVCVCTRACMCVCAHVHMHVYVQMFIHIHTLKGWYIRRNESRDHSKKDVACHLKELGFCGEGSGPSWKNFKQRSKNHCICLFLVLSWSQRGPRGTAWGWHTSWLAVSYSGRQWERIDSTVMITGKSR